MAAPVFRRHKIVVDACLPRRILGGMNEREGTAIAAICLMAAMADDSKSEAERQKLNEVFAGLGVEGEVAILRRVLLRETTLAEEAAHLQTPGLRQLAFEMAASVCDEDGGTCQAERAFLDNLRTVLDLGPSLAPVPVPVALPAVAAGAAPAPGADTRDAQADSLIIKYAILCGGLELLPQSLSTIAIIPLQMKLAHGVGELYGYALDRGHIKELLAAAGVGMTSQMLEGVARHFLGGLFKKTAGKMAGNVADAAAGAAMSFASTYAIGRIAKAHYSSGRQMNTAALRELFQREAAGGKELYSRYAGQIADQARTLSPTAVMDVLRGKATPF